MNFNIFLYFLSLSNYQTLDNWKQVDGLFRERTTGGTDNPNLEDDDLDMKKKPAPASSELEEEERKL